MDEQMDPKVSFQKLDLPRSFSLWHQGELLHFKMASLDHVDDLVKALEESKEHLRPHIDWASLPLTNSSQRARLKALEMSQNMNEAYNFHLFGSSGLLGSFSLHHRVMAQGLGWEVGYWIHPSFLKRGYGTLALHSAIWLHREFLSGQIYLQVKSSNKIGLLFLDRQGFLPSSRTVGVGLEGQGEELIVYQLGNSSIEASPGSFETDNDRSFDSSFDSAQVAAMMEKWKTKLVEVDW